MKKYKVEYMSNSQNAEEIITTSRNAKKLGSKLLGTQGGGWANIYTLRVANR